LWCLTLYYILILICFCRITFTVFCVSALSICLTSFVTVLIIKADMFDSSIDSVEMLLHQSNLEKTDYLLLQWKKEIKNNVIFQIDDFIFSRIWHLACLALSLQVDSHLYVLRVGVEMNLDDILIIFSFCHDSWLLLTTAVNSSDVLADVLHNYIMQNMFAVFEKSYQAEHIHMNSLRLQFMSLYLNEEAWHSEQLE